MRYKTHVVTSLSAGIGLTMMTDIQLTAPFLAGVLLGSLLPDIDEPGSYIGRRTQGASHIINFIFGHRGFTHSLTCAGLLFLAYHFYPLTFVLGIAFGFLFHIAGDFFSYSGVPLFMPLNKRRYSIPIYTTGGTLESAIFVAAVIGLGYLVYLNWNVWLTEFLIFK